MVVYLQPQVTPTKLDGMVSHRSPSTWEAETGQSQGQPGLHSEFPQPPKLRSEAPSQTEPNKEAEGNRCLKGEVFSRAGSVLQGSQETVGRVFKSLSKHRKLTHFRTSTIIMVSIECHKISRRHGGSCSYSQHSRG